MLSPVEQVETMRRLPLPKQIVYHAWLVVSITGVLLLCWALAIALTLLLVAVVFARSISIEDAIVLSLPAVVGFITAMGMSGSQLIPGHDLAKIGRASFRAGLVNGFASGFFFGVMWYFVLGIGAIAQEDWAYLFRPQLLIYGAIFGMAIAPAFAIFKAFATVSGDWLLHRLQRPAPATRQRTDYAAT